MTRRGSIVRPGADADPAAAQRVLRRVVQEVREHLREPREVGVQPQRSGRHRDLQRAARARRSSAASPRWRSAAPRAGRSGRAAARRCCGSPAATSSRSSVRRTRCVSCRSMVARALSTTAGSSPRQPHDVERRPNRRQRVAELVRQRRQELVLPAVGVAKLHLGELAMGHVDDHADAPVDLAVSVVERLDVVLHVERARHPPARSRSRC